ncbi:MAG: CHRD domain-containing protein [Myxococcota bacterium]
MRWLFSLGALLGALVWALASPAGAASFTYDVTLSPEVVGATGSGTATVVYNDVLHSLSITTDWTGLSGVTTVAHIHCCVATPGAGTVQVAVTPGTLPGFPVGVQSGSYTTVPILDLALNGTYTAGFLTVGGGTAAGAEAALFAGMNSGTAYLNIHSDLYPAGEIRGFLALVPEPGTSILLLGTGALLAFARRRSAGRSAQ